MPASESTQSCVQKLARVCYAELEFTAGEQSCILQLACTVSLSALEGQNCWTRIVGSTRRTSRIRMKRSWLYGDGRASASASIVHRAPMRLL